MPKEPKELDREFFARTVAELPAYKRLQSLFEMSGYTFGKCIKRSIEPGLPISSVPAEVVKDYLASTLSTFNKSQVNYVVSHPTTFDKDFYKNLVASKYSVLSGPNNVFEWMPEEILDEELVMCAIFETSKEDPREAYDDYADWFFSVHKRKPELLTYDVYVTCARLYEARRNGESRFLAITPDSYRTQEYYAAICTTKAPNIIADVPEAVLTATFLTLLLLIDTENVIGFTEEILERSIYMSELQTYVRIWRLSLMIDGNSILYIPLNEERIEYCKNNFRKGSCEYSSFKARYYSYKYGGPLNEFEEVAGSLGIDEVCNIAAGISIDPGKGLSKKTPSGLCRLPLRSRHHVPEEYFSLYDKDEYLAEVYRAIGIRVDDTKADYNYYYVELPDGISVVQDETGTYRLTMGEEAVLHYRDDGPLYDRRVYVTKILISL
jgi:hypothetical protein